MSMSLPTSSSSHVSLARPSRLLLDESSLSEAQTKLRFSPHRTHLYMSDALGGTMKNRHEVANRTPSYVDDTELQRSTANSAFCGRIKAGPGFDKTNTEMTMARMPKENSDGNPSCSGNSFNNAVETWRPPKPAKPFFLCAPRSVGFDYMTSDPENFQYTGNDFPGPKKNGEETGQLIHGLQPVPLPKPRTPFRTQLSVNRVTRSDFNHTLKCQQEKPRIPVQETVRRQPQQAISSGSPDRLLFKLPIDDPKRPFPHPIPTIDRLPLRTEGAECSQPEKEKGLIKGIESNEGFLSYPKEAFLNWIKMRNFALVSFSLYKPMGEEAAQSLSSKGNSYMFYVVTMWSTLGDISTYTKDHGRPNTSRFPIEKPARLLQINIIVPALLLRIVNPDGVTVQCYRFSAILSMVARKLKTLFMLFAIFVLLALDEIRYSLASRRSHNGHRSV